MGCASGKASKVADNAQKQQPPPSNQGDFSNINPNQQQQNPNQMPQNNQSFQTGGQGQPFQKQNLPINGQPLNGTRRTQQNPNEQDGEEYGEESFEEEYEEEMQEGNPNGSNRKSTLRKSRKSLGGDGRNTFHDSNPIALQQNPYEKQNAPLNLSPQKQITNNSQNNQNTLGTNPSERDLIMKKDQMKQNIDNMKRDLTQSPTLSKKQPYNDNMIGMFKESLEKNPTANQTRGHPSQQDLTSAIDAYQKQMREFKNSLTEMDNKLSNPVMSVSPYQIDKDNKNAGIGLGIGTQPRIQNNNNNIIYGDDTLNTLSQLSNKVNDQKIKPYSLHEPLNQQLKQQPIKDEPVTFPLNKQTENYHRQGTKIPGIEEVGPLNLQPKIQTGPVPLNDDQDEDYNPANQKYYNFDNGYKPLPQRENNQKIQPNSHTFVIGSSEGPRTETMKNPTTVTAGGNGVGMNTNMTRDMSGVDQQSSNHYKSVQNDKLSVEELNRLKDEFLEQEERERLNPQNVLLRILMIHSFNDGVDHQDEEMTLERKLYSFFVNKNSNVIDVKNKVRREFGFDVDQQLFYFRYNELQNIQYILDIERFDIEEDIIICITINAPKIHLKVILREPLDDIKIADVRFLNSRDRSEAALKNGSDFPQSIDMGNFDVDQDKLPWPLYRDWTAEAAYLSELIIKNKNFLLSDEQQFMMQQGFTQALHNSQELAELVEAESQYRRLADEFRKASLYSVHLVVKKNPTPLNLFNLYGDDGDKFIVGGLLIRRCKDWTICGHQLSELNQMTITAPGAGASGESGSALIQISGKIASLDVRNLALLRNRIESLVVPLACIVDYFGLKFEVQSLSPISINSLAYGSDLDGLLFTDFEPEAEMMAQKIAQTLNLKMHFIEEKTTKRIKRAFLPYTVQLHRNRDMGDADKKFYLANAFRLFPQDESVRQQTNNSVAPQRNNNSSVGPSILDLMAKQLRAELVINNNKGEPAPGYDFFTWKKPVKCDECGLFITDYHYYYFEKRSVDKQQRLLVQYFCCIKCYNDLLPTERFKYPVNKIMLKELQIKDRLQYWQNRDNGKRYYELQYKKIPLNSDAFLDINNPKDKTERVYDQEEILRAGQKLKDEVLARLIEELNNVDEDPLSSHQLDQLLHTMRHLGKLCTMAQLNHIREMAVIEVISRSAKILIKDGLTFLADDEEAGFRSENIKKCVLHYLQEIFNMDEYHATSTQNIWDFITEHARKKFQVTVERDVLQKIHLSSLLLSLCSKLNIKLTRSIKDINFYANIAQEGGDSFLTINDIDSITPIVKDYQEQMMTDLALIAPQDRFPSSLHMIQECARLKDAEGKRSQWFMIGGDERVEATELFRMACSICEQVYGGQNSIQYARALKEMAEHLESRHQERGRPENSRWNKCQGVTEDELSMESRYYYQNALQVLTDIKHELSIETAEIYVGLARLFKPRAPQFSHYRETQNNIAEMYQNLATAIDIYETLLGFDHPETADAYTKMALAYQENGSFPAASPWIRRAFCVFFKCFGPHDPITLNCWEQLKSIETNIDSKLEQVPYEDLPQVIFDIEKQEKHMADQSQLQQAQFQMMPPQQQMQIGAQGNRIGSLPQRGAFQNSMQQSNQAQRLMIR